MHMHIRMTVVVLRLTLSSMTTLMPYGGVSLTTEDTLLGERFSFVAILAASSFAEGISRNMAWKTTVVC